MWIYFVLFFLFGAVATVYVSNKWTLTVSIDNKEEIAYRDLKYEICDTIYKEIKRTVDTKIYRPSGDVAVVLRGSTIAKLEEIMNLP